MSTAPTPANEADRLAVLRGLRLAELASEMDIDRITRLAKRVASSAYCLIVLLEAEEVIAIGHCGTADGPVRVPRNGALAEWTVAHAEPVFWVDDCATDRRFCEARFIATPPYARFYAGAPIVVRGARVGSVAVSDTEIRRFDQETADRLADVAAVIANEFELKIAKSQLVADEIRTRQEKTILDVLIEDAPMALAMFDRDMRYIRASRRWRGERGLDDQSLVGRTYDELSPETAGRWRAVYERCLNGATERCDRERIMRGGEETWLRWEVTPWYDGSDAVGGLVIMTEDLTDQVRRTEQLVQSETRLRLATEIADLTVWEYSFDDRALRYASGRMPSAFTGDLSYDRLIDEWLNRIHLDDREEVEALWAQHVDTGALFHAEYRERDRIGRVLWRQNVADTIRDAAGRPERIVGVIRDVTERKQSELAIEQSRAEAEDANRAKSDFLANMSHEIRTPLNGVLGVASALGRTDLNDDQRQMVQIIEHSGQVLEALLSDVLDLARIESGKLSLREEAFDLSGALKEIASLFEAGAAEKGLELAVEIDPDLTGAFTADPVRMRQVVSNLLSNAVKFTARGTVALRASVTGEADGATAVRIDVSDTGIGFDEATRRRLFERFEQADGSITRRFGGTGLGLAISRSLAEMMGGKLWAQSTPGEGATFTLELALHRTQAVEPGKAARSATAAPLAGPVRVLLAEDHPTNRRVVELILEGTGVELTAVENGALAVEMFGLADFDLILMDMQMPVMDGLNATRSIRATEKAEGRAPTPIYALTANAMPEHVQQTKAAGADGHLTKPLSAEALLTLVASVAGVAAPAEDAAAA